MKYLVVTLFIAIMFFSQETEAQSKIKLFNGKNLNGWYAFETETGKHENASELFSVENKMIRLYGKKAGYLMSEKLFSNFQLTAEFRWNTDTTFVRKNNKMNSGLMYLVPKETPDILWPKGIQFQIKKGATGDFILLKNVTIDIDGTSTEAGRSVVAKRATDAAKPIGEWNKIKITVNNGFVTQELNGVIVNEGTNSSVSEGRILLQYEGFPIDFRRIKIKCY